MADSADPLAVASASRRKRVLLSKPGSAKVKRLRISSQKDGSPSGNTPSNKARKYPVRRGRRGATTAQQQQQTVGSKFEKYSGKVFICQHCQCSLTNRKFQKRHESGCPKNPSRKKAAEAEKQFVCGHCDFASAWKRDLTRHINTKHEKKQVYDCTECDYTTSNSGNMRQHWRVHAKVPEFTCQTCQKGFNRKASLDSHMLKQHPELSHLITSKIYNCTDCSYSTVKRSHLSYHMSIHGTERAKLYSCQYCSYETDRKSPYDTHMRIHTDEKPWACAKCKKKFIQKIHLDSHILNNHKNDKKLIGSMTNKIHSCTFCKYETVLKTVLTNHLKLHK